MMADRKFHRVTAEGFNGAREPLKQAGWDSGGQAASGQGAQVVALCGKLIFEGLDALREVMAPEEVRSKEADFSWDRAQQRLTLGVQLKLTDPEPAIRAAAQIVHDALLWPGGGTGQVRLTYEQEVDFGLKQIDDAATPHVAQALQAADLNALFQEASDATRAFSDLLGRSPDQKKLEARSVRERQAVRSCVTTFELVYAVMSRLIAVTPPGAEQDALKRRLIPLDDLADRAS